MRMRIATLLVAAAALGGCAYNGLGLGVGYGNGYYDPYYGAGYGYSPYGYSPYGYGSYAYSPFGYGYGSPYGGWYNGYYYPGSGFYVYDRDHNRRQITDAERQYWRQRVASALINRTRSSDGLTTNSTRTTRVFRSPSTTTTTTTTTSDRRERFRDALRTRIEERRAARAQRKND